LNLDEKHVDEIFALGASVDFSGFVGGADGHACNARTITPAPRKIRRATSVKAGISA
jgi:hypothetical protein